MTFPSLVKKKTAAFVFAGFCTAIAFFFFYATKTVTSPETAVKIIQDDAGNPALTQPVDTPAALVVAGNDAVASDDIEAKAAVELSETPENVAEMMVPDTLSAYEIQPHETLSALLKRAGVSNAEAYKITEALSEVLNLKQIQVGDSVDIGTIDGEDGSKTIVFVTLENRHGFKYTALRNSDDFFEGSLIEPKVEIQTEYAEGTINGTFLNSAKEAGVPTNVAQQIIWAFDGPVDFRRDLRKGDSFLTVFHKEYNEDGKPTGNGSLLYAAFTMRSTTHERFLYEDSNGATDYYDETGKIARRLLVMHPLARPRVTSSFGMRRHPVLKYTTMHWGTDFGAPIGTPIRAPGDGTVTFAGTKGGYGQYVQIKHNSEYSTAYGHMSRIATQTGRKIRAGQILGYVGNTGRSTGPHLHWEMIKNGRKINPTMHKITAQRKLTGKELKRFMKERDIVKNDLLASPALVRARPMDEARKMAYQEPEKPVKTRSRSSGRKTASRQTRGRIR